MVRHDMARPSATRREGFASMQEQEQPPQPGSGEPAAELNARALTYSSAPPPPPPPAAPPPADPPPVTTNALGDSDASDRHHDPRGPGRNRRRVRNLRRDHNPVRRIGRRGRDRERRACRACPNLRRGHAHRFSRLPRVCLGRLGPPAVGVDARYRACGRSRSSWGCSSSSAATSARSSASAIAGGITYYLFQPDIQRAFGRTTT